MTTCDAARRSRPPRALRRATAAAAAAAALAAGTLLGACTVGPDFTPPRADVPAGWHALQRADAAAPSSGASAPASTPTTDADPDPRWWRAFGDPLLDRLVERAARDNLDVQAAVLRIAQARAQVRAAAAQGLPDVRASASYQREQLGLKGFVEDQGLDRQIDRLGAPGSPLDRLGPGTGAAVQQRARGALDALESPVNLWQAGFDASWELDLFGRVRRAVEAADAQAGAAV
ncbi:RND transporter, partial [Burkholderia multivorans]